MKIAIGLIAGLPASWIVVLDLALVTGLNDCASGIFALVWLLSWGTLAYISSRAASARRAFGRASLAYSIAAFALPVAATAYTVASAANAEDSFELLGAAVAGSVLIAIGVVFGFFTGIIGALLAYFSLKGRPGNIQT